MGTSNRKVTSVISNSYKYREGERLVRYLKEDYIHRRIMEECKKNNIPVAIMRWRSIKKENKK
jgi:macrodomain Ter protein organizer (MatP/YcbG family)